MNHTQRTDIQQRAASLISEAERLSNIINTTIDEAEFDTSYNEIITIFRELCSYEKYHIFKGQSPRQNLKEIQSKRAKATNNLYERQRKFLSADTGKRNYTDVEIQDIYFSSNIYEIDAGFTCAGELATDKGYISLFMIVSICKESLPIAQKLLQQLEAFHVIQNGTILERRKALMTPNDFSKLVYLISDSETARNRPKQIENKNVSITQPKHICEHCDPLFVEAGRLIVSKDKASIGMLQRALQIGFNQASRIMNQLYDYGVVGEEEGTRPRKVLMTSAQFEILLEEINSPIRNERRENQAIDIDNMEGHQFEYFCADTLRKNGFSNVEVTQGSGDHGIDILAEKDDITYAIQCKCYSSNIGNAAVQQAFTGKKLYKKDVAVVMTNQYFTQQAKEEATALGVKLWDRDKLNNFIQNANL